MGVKLHEEDTMKYDEQSLEQWEAYKLDGNISVSKSLSKILDYLEYKGTNEYSAITRLMIIPGYSFKVAQELITNFHQPKSTLLMLVAAFIGADWRKVYDYALSNDFRMLSYGDSSL